MSRCSVTVQPRMQQCFADQHLPPSLLPQKGSCSRDESEIEILKVPFEPASEDPWGWSKQTKLELKSWIYILNSARHMCRESLFAGQGLSPHNVGREEIQVSTHWLIHHLQGAEEGWHWVCKMEPLGSMCVTEDLKVRSCSSLKGALALGCWGSYWRLGKAAPPWDCEYIFYLVITLTVK